MSEQQKPQGVSRGSEFYNNPKVAAGVAIVVLIIAGLIMLLRAPGNNGGSQVAKPVAQATHIVKRGEYLRNIAPQYANVSWESILLENESFLKEKYTETCEPLPERVRVKLQRRSLFCNDRYNRPYGNTLKAGWQLVIPAGTAPADVEQTIKDFTAAGDKVDVVIDDSGSMGNDRRVVAQFYLAALQKHGRNIGGVYLYVDGTVRRLEVPKDIESEMRTTGDIENTYEALRTAASDDHPDKIILITDEPGDDWPRYLGSINLPPVIANCLSDGGYSCDGTLREVARVTHGQYVAYRN